MHTAVCFLLASLAVASAGQSAKQAASQLPVKYRSGILEAKGPLAYPDSEEWVFVCTPAGNGEGPVQIRVRERKIVGKEPLGVFDSEGRRTPIDLMQVVVDSRGALEIARRYVISEKKGQLVKADAVLTQQGVGFPPIWSVWCYGPQGKYIGQLRLLAPSGHVVQWE
jgi:hypothetical protein